MWYKMQIPPYLTHSAKKMVFANTVVIFTIIMYSIERTSF